MMTTASYSAGLQQYDSQQFQAGFNAACQQVLGNGFQLDQDILNTANVANPAAGISMRDVHDGLNVFCSNLGKLIRKVQNANNYTLVRGRWDYSIRGIISHFNNNNARYAGQNGQQGAMASHNARLAIRTYLNQNNGQTLFNALSDLYTTFLNVFYHQ